MMDPFYFDYEFVFDDDFSQEVFDACPLPDLDSTRLAVVQDVVSKLKNIITAQPGIREISSFGHHNEFYLKISINNTAWVPPSA